MMRAIYGITDLGAAIAMVPKVGLQSFRYSLSLTGKQVGLSEALLRPVRVQFVRHPFRRLESCYRHYKTIYSRGNAPQLGDPSHEDVASWNAFMGFVRHSDNAHTTPQSLVTDEFSPTHLHRFEDVLSIWPSYHSLPYPHLNFSLPHEVGEVPDDVAALYNQDLKLWLSL